MSRCDVERRLLVSPARAILISRCSVVRASACDRIRFLSCIYGLARKYRRNVSRKRAYVVICNKSSTRFVPNEEKLSTQENAGKWHVLTGHFSGPDRPVGPVCVSVIPDNNFSSK